MIPITSFEGKRVALFGLGISGLSAAAALVAGGAEVLLYDDNAGRRDEAAARGFVVEDLKTHDWSDIEALVLSPGVPLTHPEPHWVVEKARAAFVPVIGDTELFFAEFLKRGARLRPEASFGGNDRVIVITGTNGKSTTTALTTHILQEAGERAVMGGNIGYGVLDMPDLGGGRVYVLELSSYQIDLTPSLKPTAAGLLNISPDHIDRHGTVENYAAVKARIFDQLYQEGDEPAAALGVLSLDDDYCRLIARDLPPGGRFAYVSLEPGVADGALLSDDGFQLMVDGRQVDRVDLQAARSLRGRHNAQNAAFAYLLASEVTENIAGLKSGLLTFPGLAHRMQEIGRYEAEGLGIAFVNDSKATNAEASQQALNSFEAIYWIAGGRAKEGGIAALIPHLGAVRRAFLIGEAAAAFAATLDEAGIAAEISEDMERAVAAAFAAAKEAGEGEVAVMLSPAAASFDQYPNFEVRGGAFEEIVNRLEGVVPTLDGGK